MLWILRNFRRNRLAKRPMPPEWDRLIDAHYPFVATLGDDEAARFRTHLKVFAWEKYWFGLQGQDITDEITVVVSGAAARLSRNISLHVYDRLTEILIYPSHYKHPDGDAIIYGEAHQWGTVVLSWDAVRHGIAIPNDGHDTAIHEFAHVLDVADGTFDGTPELHEASDYRRWAYVLSRHFNTLRQGGGRQLLREYGATNEAEFFAVATEVFFEKSEALARRAPDLYETLATYYRVDPAGTGGTDKTTTRRGRRSRRR